jgi:hypothetical protein
LNFLQVEKISWRSLIDACSPRLASTK